MPKGIILLLHLSYWALFAFTLFILAFIVPQQLSDKGAFLNPRYTMHVMVTVALPSLAGFYSYYAFLFPRFLFHKRIVAFFVWAIGLAFLSGLLGLANNYLVSPWLPLFRPSIAPAIELIILIAILTAINGAIGLFIKGFITWYNDIKSRKELAKRNHDVEMALIKSQINPHFLFNTINNIDVLIGTDPDKASDYLNRLSDIMRFMLYEAKDERIQLSRELEYLEKYIALQRIRSGNPEFVHFEVIGQPAGIEIAPMLFIPFVENAFKHVAASREATAININVKINGLQLVFECDNLYNTMAQAESSNGLGNGLIRRRLDLLYPASHTLAIKKENHHYRVMLTIERNEHHLHHS